MDSFHKFKISNSITSQSRAKRCCKISKPAKVVTDLEIGSVIHNVEKSNAGTSIVDRLEKLGMDC